MFDRNPSDENAIFSDADLKNIETIEMKLLRDGDFGFWACPVCMTDDYLADIISIEEITNLIRPPIME